MNRVHLAIGPINQCGQPYFWANAVRDHLAIDAKSFAPSGVIARHMPGANLKGPAHYSIPHQRISIGSWRSLRTRVLLRNTSHLLGESLLPVFRSPPRFDLGDDLEELERLGVRTGIVCHGSDIRDPESHLRRHEFSYFSEASDEWVSRLGNLVRKNSRLIKDSGLPTFVTTPDLLLDVPTASWLPLAIDIDYWQNDAAPAMERKVPVVLHLPSRRDPPIKGTRFIDPILEDLQRKGRIRYLSPESVPHTEIKSLVQDADIVVDQILTGSYGVAAIEAMAAERVVVGFVGDATKGMLAESPPIVDANPRQFATVMDELLSSRDESQSIARKGADYARCWHDGSASAEALRGFLE